MNDFGIVEMIANTKRMLNDCHFEGYTKITEYLRSKTVYPDLPHSNLK